MKILIIGVKGFIGSHIKNFFTEKHVVIGADISPSPEEPNYCILDKNIPDFESLFNKLDFDICVNASGNGSVPISMTKPMLDFQLNVLNTISILEAIRKYCPRCKYINLSSAAVYGNPEKLPINETDFGVPLSPYGWHKLNSEQLCKEYHVIFGLQTLSLRLFSVYGENLKKQIFWDIFQKAMKSTHVSLFGTGKETRDFIYIEDLLQALQCIISNAIFSGEAINIASGTEITIKHASTLFCKELNEEIVISFNNQEKKGDPLQWKADISQLKGMGFIPCYTIETGIKNIAKWYLANK